MLLSFQNYTVKKTDQPFTFKIIIYNPEMWSVLGKLRLRLGLTMALLWCNYGGVVNGIF